MGSRQRARFEVSQDLMILSRNAAATRLIAERSQLFEIDGHLAAVDAVTTRAIRGLVADVCFRIDGAPGRGGELSLPMLADGSIGLRLSVVPVGRHTTERKAIVRVEQAAPDSTADEEISVLVARYRLSKREAQVASFIGNGHSVFDIARRLGINVTTVRTHLSKVFRKTGCHRQSQLAALVSVLLPNRSLKQL
jgi:DNA-binding CsgD family transcriptional regulator